MNNERYTVSLELAAHTAIAKRLLENRLITQEEFRRISRQIALDKHALIASKRSAGQAHTRRINETAKV